jgi:hypothetical protein
MKLFLPRSLQTNTYIDPVASTQPTVDVSGFRTSTGYSYDGCTQRRARWCLTELLSRYAWNQSCEQRSDSRRNWRVPTGPAGRFWVPSRGRDDPYRPCPRALRWGVLYAGLSVYVGTSEWALHVRTPRILWLSAFTVCTLTRPANYANRFSLILIHKCRTNSSLFHTYFYIRHVGLILPIPLGNGLLIRFIAGFEGHLELRLQFQKQWIS